MNPIYYWLVENKPKEWSLKKVQILSTFISMISKGGVENLSPESLAKEMGLARSHVIYYFKDRESLYKEALSFIAQTAQLITIDKWSAAPENKKVEAVVEGAFAWAENLPEHACAYALLQYFASRRADYRNFLSEIRVEGKKRLMQAIQLRYTKEKLPTKKLETVALHIQLVILGYITEAIVSHAFKSLQDARARCAEQVELYLKDQLG